MEKLAADAVKPTKLIQLTIGRMQIR